MKLQERGMNQYHQRRHPPQTLGLKSTYKSEQSSIASARPPNAQQVRTSLHMLRMHLFPKVIFVPSPPSPTLSFPVTPHNTISDASLAYLIVYLVSDSVFCKLV